VLTSVHSFAADPARGLFILVFLCLVIGGSLTLYAWRAPEVTSGGRFSMLSRETMLLGNNLLLVVITAFILLGTLAPLLYDAFGWGKISVGFPWFTTMFVIFTPFMVILMGLGPLTRWKHHEPAELLRTFRVALLASLAAGLLVALPILHDFSPWAGLAVLLSVWLLSSLVLSLRQRYRNRATLRALLKNPAARGNGSYFGMLIAHLGVAVFIIGITFVTQFEAEQDVRMSPGQSIDMAGYTFRFDGVQHVQGPNYRAEQGTIHVTRDGSAITTLRPEKRTYTVQRKPMTEAGIDGRLMRDIYVSLGEGLGGGDWSLRLYYKPYVRWIWLGGLLIAFGGLLAALDRRYRIPVRQPAVQATRESGKTVTREAHS
jgi:cytochrome c-type biogenesis protein CcmF